MFELLALMYTFVVIFCAYKSVETWVYMVPLEVSKKRLGGRKRIIRFLAINPISAVKKDWVKTPKLLDSYLVSWEAVKNGNDYYDWVFSFCASIAVIVIFFLA